MEKHFSEMAKCLSSKTHYVMVVGDSNVSDVFFNTADFFVDIAERNGFRITNKWGYKIKNYYMLLCLSLMIELKRTNSSLQVPNAITSNRY